MKVNIPIKEIEHEMATMNKKAASRQRLVPRMLILIVPSITYVTLFDARVSWGWRYRLRREGRKKAERLQCNHLVNDTKCW